METEAPTGSKARLIGWFKRWRKPLRNWLRGRSVPNADIEDVAQEVFVRLMRYSEDALVENPEGYLFKIASNVAHEWRNRARVRYPHDDSWLDDLLIEDNEEPENIKYNAQRQAAVEAAIGRLPARQQHVLLLHINGGQTYQQIAEAEGVKYRRVLRDLTKAYSALRHDKKLRIFG